MRAPAPGCAPRVCKDTPWDSARVQEDNPARAAGAAAHARAASQPEPLPGPAAGLGFLQSAILEPGPLSP